MDNDDAFWEEIKPDLTPLIDGVFLLLIFFMVSMIFARPVHIEIELPQAHQSSGLQQRDLKLYVSKTGNMRIDEKSLNLEEAESALRYYANANKESTLIILGDRHTTHGYTLALMAAAQRAGINKIYLATKSNTVDPE